MARGGGAWQPLRDGVEHAICNGQRTTRSAAAWQLFFCEREAAASQIAWLRGEPANDTSLRALDRQVRCGGKGFSAMPTGATERLCTLHGSVAKGIRAEVERG